jgi:uncharacterized protein involved in response to NO
VIFWQFAVLTPVLALLVQILTGGGRSLGTRLDWIVGAGALTILQSGLTAMFPNPARWHGIAALGLLAALYACNAWVHDRDRRQRILTFQGFLQIAFIVLSLSLWTFQTALPELSRLQGLGNEWGISLPFSFEQIENRNWAPIGHQNYVAGYLTLAIPSLVGLGLTTIGPLRWLWLGGTVLGLLDLYTTTSRAGFLGLGVATVVTIGLFMSRLQPSAALQLPNGWVLSKRILLWASGGFLGAIGLGLAATGRFSGLINGLKGGYVPGELAYRTITNAIGVAMGTHSPLTGTGIGSAVYAYQKFRPVWSGREAELAYQLHSTPAQLFGELGILGLGLWASLLVWLGFCWWRGRDRFSPLTHSLFAALVAYSVQSLTDYQIDNLCISGTIVLFLAAIAAELRAELPSDSELPLRFQRSAGWSKGLAFGLMGGLLAAILWLIPVDRAWMLSKQGFDAISNIESPDLKPDDRSQAIQTFVQSLETAHQLVPWEPYYPQQLAWILGDLGQKMQNPEFITRSIQTFEIARQSAPYQEFVYANLGALQIDRNPHAATEAFKTATQLVPAKQGGFEALGMSLVREQKIDLAIEAFALEITRNPKLLATLSRWKGTPIEPLIAPVIQKSEALYSELITQARDKELIIFLRGCRGALRWWTGNRSGAQADAEASQYIFLQKILAMGDKPSDKPGVRIPIDLEPLKPILPAPAIATLTAWNQPNHAPRLLQQAWIRSAQKPMPTAVLDQLLQTLQSAKSLDDWLKSAPVRTYRRSRSGFNVLSRHTDGVNPEDFYELPENLIMQSLMGDLLPEWKYYPSLEIPLQTYREKLWAKI